MTDIVDATGTAVPKVMSDQLAGRDRENAERRSEIIRTRMSPKGALKLPKLLDERRLEYGVTDRAFDWHAAVGQGASADGNGEE